MVLTAITVSGTVETSPGMKSIAKVGSEAHASMAQDPGRRGQVGCQELVQSVRSRMDVRNINFSKDDDLMMSSS